MEFKLKTKGQLWNGVLKIWEVRCFHDRKKLAISALQASSNTRSGIETRLKIRFDRGYSTTFFNFIVMKAKAEFGR